MGSFMGNWMEMRRSNQKEKMVQSSLLLPRISVNPHIRNKNCPIKSGAKVLSSIPNARSFPPGVTPNSKIYISL